MSGNISHKGTTILISASNTTAGVPIPILETADDTDPLTFEDRTIADAAVDTNGNMVRWSMASLINASLAINPSTAGYETLQLIFGNNAEGGGVTSNNDVIKLYRILPNGSALELSNGIIISGPPAEGQSSSGRLTTGTFTFRFGRIKRAPAIIELLN